MELPTTCELKTYPNVPCKNALHAFMCPHFQIFHVKKDLNAILMKRNVRMFEGESDPFSSLSKSQKKPFVFQ